LLIYDEYMLRIKDLEVNVEDKKILHGIDLEIKPGEVHCIMGPNGAGKSTLVNSIMGHPKYNISGGSIEMDSANILEMEVFERACHGLFLAFQYPKEIEGVTMLSFLLSAYNAQMSARDENFKSLKAFKFKKLIRPLLEQLDIDESFLQRYINHGFSGGEKKKSEVLQLKLFQPKYALLDETDSGLDVDALKIVSDGINDAKKNGMGVLIVTHYQRILDYVQPDVVHVLKDGKIVQSGGAEFAKELESKGYQWIE
jgi:Fe-S cluster assembly ATP-binding protein